MRRPITLFLLLFTLSLSACTSGAEESTGTTPEDDDAAVLALLFGGGLYPPSGFAWEGSANIESCIGSTTDINVFCTTLLLEGLQIQQIYQRKNFTLFLQYPTGTLTGQLALIAPHFNVAPYSYVVGATGAITPGSWLQSPIISLTQTGVVSTNPNHSIQINNFRAEDRPEALVGSFEAVLSATGITGFATLIYNFSATKTL